MGKIRPVTRDEHRACFVLSRIAYFCVREISPHEWQICVNFALESHETRRTQRRGGVRTLSKFLWLPRGDGGGVEGFWWCLTCWTIFSSPQIPRHNRSWRCNETPSPPFSSWCTAIPFALEKSIKEPLPSFFFWREGAAVTSPGILKKK